MTKYHVNSATGNARICRAFVNCPFGGEEEHYPTTTEAQAAYQRKMYQSTIPSLKTRFDYKQYPEIDLYDSNDVTQGIYAAFSSEGERLYVGLSENVRKRCLNHHQALKRNSKTKKNWAPFYKDHPETISWRLVKRVTDRSDLNAEENSYWNKLHPKFNDIEPKISFHRTGGDTSKKHPGEETLKAMNQTRTIPEIAKELNVTKSVVYAWFRDGKIAINNENNLSHQTRLAYDSKESEILKDVEDYVPITSIARRHQISRLELLRIFESRNVVFGYNLTKQKVSKESLEKALRSELTRKSIAEEMNIPYSHLMKLTKEYRLEGLWSK